ncbi:hypothetical protein D3C87_1838540 [compost metagenome]
MLDDRRFVAEVAVHRRGVDNGRVELIGGIYGGKGNGVDIHFIKTTVAGMHCDDANAADQYL